MYDRIKSLCAVRGLTIQMLEFRLNMSNGSIAKWKTSCPKADNLALVANALGVSMEFLLFGEVKDPPQSWDGFSKEEIEVIQLFRNASPSVRAGMLQILRGLEAQE